MACYKLTSCTAANNTVIYSNSNLAAYEGLSISISLYGVTCFTVELVDPACDCPGAISVTVIDPDCACSSPYFCYLLTECNNTIPAFYASTNLAPYIGQYISVVEHPGLCFFVSGQTDLATCEEAIPAPIPVTCVESCACGPQIYCYELTNCLANPPVAIIINSTSILALTIVIAPSPAIIPTGGNNCWQVTGVDLTPCTAGTGTTVNTFTDYGVDNCVICAGPARCYELTNCQDPNDIIYSQEPALAGFVGLFAASAQVPGKCFRVANAATCPIQVPFASPFECQCACYTLTNCRTQAIITTNSDLFAYIGLSVQIDPPNDAGCEGDCWLVTETPGPCGFPVEVVVSLDCAPCPPCGETCYEIVDCETDIVFTTLQNPTLNGVNLATLLGGQTLGQICIEGVPCEFGCWYVRVATDCLTAVAANVYDVYQSCNECLNSCYGLLNCETLTVDHIIKYTVPNSNPLIPNPATLVGSTIGNLCFDLPTGCVTGCYQLQLIPGASCTDSVDWTTVVSYTNYDDCESCLPKCYLLTECAPAVSTPFVVNNDLSFYVGNVAKICDSLGVCHCYQVEIAQSCTGAITIDNANASFITCEECNSCNCPPGYTKIDDICQKITSIPAILNPRVYGTESGSIDPLYGYLGTNFYNNISTLPFPITAVVAQFEDAATTPVPFVNNVVGVWNGPAGGRLNTIGIWTLAAPNPVNEWIGFSHCIENTDPTVYCIGIAGDDCVRIKIDGVLAVEACSGGFDYNYWHVFEVILQAGTHTIVVEGKNLGGAATFGAEIYNVSSAILQTYTTSAQLQVATIFTTFSFKLGGEFQTGETSGYSCGPGYTLNTCDPVFTCSLIETIPFVPCSDTYIVTDCTGAQTPFITNTDLSAYLTGSHKVCLTDIIYSTTCFVLKDCNRLFPDIITDTDLTINLWETVTLEGFDGGCFIVTGVPAGNPCVDPVPVVVLPASCDCPGAQAPWPEGCYCITVEQVLPIIATEFTGLFEPTEFECCEDCLRVCYLLTSCSAGIDPVVVCNDLADYIGLVIKIESCGDICWQVEVSSTCDSDLKFSGAITTYSNCVDCLPPVPPTPPPFDLHLRKIKPGYDSPNSCVTLEYLEKVNCTFAEQVYNAMLIPRYGITVCCDEDIDKWDIKKQLLDLTLLKDPGLCKSTLCDCPPPCLLSVEIEVLPFCGAPTIVAVDLVVACGAPVINDVVIDVPITPSPCYCWSVENFEQPVTLAYLDCCCVVQYQVIDTIGITIICASTTPVSTTPTPLTILNTGLCGEEGGLCDPPPPQVCSCWRISNTGNIVGSYIIDAVCPSGEVAFGTTGTIVPGSPDIFVCSIAPPIVTDLVYTNTGACDGYCGPIPPACVCYEIDIPSEIPGCTFDYIDCDGMPVVGYQPIQGKNYICAQTMPVTSNCVPVQGNPPLFTITSTPWICTDGTCGPPFACDCYKIVITEAFGLEHGFSYYDCTGQWLSVSLPDGTYYYCGSNFNNYFDPAVVITPAPGLCEGC